MGDSAAGAFSDRFNRGFLSVPEGVMRPALEESPPPRGKNGGTQPSARRTGILFTGLATPPRAMASLLGSKEC